MVGPRDAVSPGWDALAPATGRDALAVPAADAFSATYAEPSADALAVGYRADALAAGDAATGDAVIGDAVTGGALAAIGDGFGDSLTVYGDATAAGEPGARPTTARRPRPGPVPPRPTADDGPAADGVRAGRATTGRGDSDRQSGRGGSTPSPRRAAGSAAGRTTSRTGTGGSTAGRTGRAGSAAGGPTTPTRRGSAAGNSTTPIRFGSAAGGSPTPARRGPGTGGGYPVTGGSGARGSASSGAGRGRTPESEDSYGGPPRDRPGPGGQAPSWSNPWWANRTGRPTGTVPWEGRSGRSGWDDFLAGMGGSADRSGKRPSGAEVARALLEAFRRGMRDR